MGRSVRLAPLMRACVQPVCVVFALILLTFPALAQNSGRTVIDFEVKGDRLFVEITVNAEALLAGLDPQDAATGTDSALYAKLRRLVSSDLETELHEHINEWKELLKIEANGPVALSYEGARIPVVGNPDVPRLSRVLLAGPLPKGAADLSLTWPGGIGPVVLRQQGVEAPYTGFLNAGETSPRIPLRGGAGLSAQKTAAAFFRAGLLRITTNGAQQVALVLTLVFLSFSFRSLVLQVLVLAPGVLASLPLGVFGVIPITPQTVSVGLSAAIVVLALWNLAVRQLGGWRLLAVFFAGVLFGLQLATDISQLGVSPLQVAPALLGFGTGALLAMACVAGFAFATMTLLLPNAPRLRGRVSTVASILLVGVGGYWSILPFLQF